jgi:hypothetical protein
MCAGRGREKLTFTDALKKTVHHDIAASAPTSTHTRAWAANCDVRLSFVVAACLLVEAVVAKEVLDVSLDYLSQMAALWVFIAYLVTGRHGKSTARAFGLAAVAVTAAVLGIYAL